MQMNREGNDQQPRCSECNTPLVRAVEKGICANCEEKRKQLLQEFAAKIASTKPDESAIRAARAAVSRLIEIARRDTGQSRIVANFLLAWWNAEECGGFNLTELWGVDTEIAADMITIFSTLPRWCHYPDALGYSSDFAFLVSAWRDFGPESSKAGVKEREIT